MRYAFPLADCRSRTGNCELEIQLTSPLTVEEIVYPLTGVVSIRCAPLPASPDLQAPVCPLQGAICEGGSVRVRALATGLTEEAFLDAQGIFHQDLELQADADNPLELAVCDGTGRERFRLPVYIRHGTAGRPPLPEVAPAPVPTARPTVEAVEPPWPDFAQLVKHCLHLAADTADITGRDRHELFEHVYTQERYAERALAQRDAVLYRECWDNLEKYAGYLDQLLHGDLPRPQTAPTRSPEEEAQAGLEQLRDCLSAVWKRARAAGRADLEEHLKQVAEQGRGLTQRAKADALAAVRELRRLLSEVARIEYDLREDTGPLEGKT